MNTPPVWTPWHVANGASAASFWDPQPPPPRPISAGQRALAVVSDVYGVAAERIRSQARGRAEACARQALCYVLREGLLWSYPRIGRFVRRDHTTVIYSVEKARAVARADVDFAAQLREALARTGGA